MRTVVVVLTAIFLLATVPAAAGESKEDLQKKFESRLKELQSYKKADKLGETNKGYVEALKKEYLKDKKLDKIIKNENSDRKKLYTLIAKKQKAAVENVGRQNAIIKFKKAGMEEYFKGKDGKWRRKRDMLKK